MRHLKFLLITISLIVFSTSCCNEEKKYEYVKNNCKFIYYQDDIRISKDIEIFTCVINTYNKITNLKVSLIDIFKENISKWDDGTTSIILPKEIPTNRNWEIVLKDEIIYNITEINVEAWGGKTMFCEHYVCSIKSYKRNNSLIESNIIKL